MNLDHFSFSDEISNPGVGCKIIDPKVEDYKVSVCSRRAQDAANDMRELDLFGQKLADWTAVLDFKPPLNKEVANEESLVKKNTSKGRK
jgi:hypothetical protein